MCLTATNILCNSKNEYPYVIGPITNYLKAN